MRCRHARSDCGAILVRRFMERLETGDEGCAAAVPAVRLVPRFARHLRELPAARALAGNAAGEDQLRAVSAALLTSADVIARAEENGAGAGVGLRGGTFTVREARHGYRLSLREVRWTEDAAVSGRIDWPRRSGVVHADLELWTSQGLRGALQLQWPEGVNGATATVPRPLGKQFSGGGRAGTLGRRGGRPLAAHATGGIYQQPRSRTHHGESGPDQKTPMSRRDGPTDRQRSAWRSGRRRYRRC